MDPKRSRTLWGTLLIVAGCLLMLEALGVPGASPVLPALFGAAGLASLYAFFGDSAGRPWAALPGFALLGLAASALWRTVSPGSGWAVALALGGLGVGFFASYLAARERPRAPVPGGAPDRGRALHDPRGGRRRRGVSRGSRGRVRPARARARRRGAGRG